MRSLRMTLIKTAYLPLYKKGENNSSVLTFKSRQRHFKFNNDFGNLDTCGFVIVSNIADD